MIARVPFLSGPFQLTQQTVMMVVRQKSIGAYALGTTQLGRILPLYVGRSGEDLQGRLLKHVMKYSNFGFSYALSPMGAYQLECEMYHYWKPRDNAVHPARPDGSNWRCPICTQ